jgi:small-conductance mechanosensitive channel
MVWTRRSLVLAILLLAALPPPIVGQTAAVAQPQAAPPRPDPLATAIATAARTAQTTDLPATLVYSNRPIVELRATALGRSPSARAAAAADLLDRLVDRVPAGRVTTRAFDAAVAIGIDANPVFVVLTADVDPLAGEDLATKTAEATSRLQVAFDEAVELRTPAKLVTGALVALAVTVLYILAIWGLVRIDRRLAARLSRAAERRLLALPGGDIMVGIAHAPTYLRRAFTFGSVILGVVLTYAWLTIVLRRFPYTRPWGESLRAGLFTAAAATGRRVVDELPNLLAVLGIVIITRFLVRLTTLAFKAVEEGRIAIPGVYAETAQPTRRIAVALLWLCALIASYAYLPGSESDAFKGVSVFVGLIISLGSTGVMNQVMSGLMVTYSRAVRLGDFVKLADIEGTVTYLGTLSTKIKTARNEEITIPNALVVSYATTNYSRHAGSDGVFVPTSVTIGYDAPWRQVRALLLLAAERTPGVRTEPKPIVLQTALHDFHVQYTLLVCLEQPQRRYRVLDVLHANIQDAFNEYGVQIMTPNYEADPSGPKVVPPSRWYAAPAAPPPEIGRPATTADGAARERAEGA